MILKNLTYSDGTPLSTPEQHMKNNINDVRTKTEWRALYDDNGFYFISALFCPSPYIVATGGEGDVDEANARFIALSCNTHDLLLKACKDAFEERKKTHHGDDALLSQLNDAINKCEAI